jgi:bifunctional non-homologous end joining protein LigD
MKRSAPLRIPSKQDAAVLSAGGRSVRLTNLRKLFWPDLGIAKADLLAYYAAVSPWLLPHLRDRAMVMKRYPHGASGEFFFMKRAPEPRPEWIRTCSIRHGSGTVIAFPMIQDLASLLWVVNLGCIDLNPWYSRCDETDRPDFLHFDLDPFRGASFSQVRETALLVRENLEKLGMKSFAKTTGSRGIHVYVAIQRGPLQKQVWAFAKEFAQQVASFAPRVATSEYRIAKRPARRVLIDYNQNAWGRTLASIYSVRPTPLATVSVPLKWEEIEKGAALEDFRIGNVIARLEKTGDLWAALLSARGRFRLEKFL